MNIGTSYWEKRRKMARKRTDLTIFIDGMTCVSCENRIENALRKTTGIETVKVSFGSAKAVITYDASIIHPDSIEKVIESLDYRVRKPVQNASRTPQPGNAQTAGVPQVKKTSISQVLGILIILGALFMLINRFGGFNIFNSFPQAEQGMGYGLLFLIGILTSIHCVAMCGGINLSQCVPKQAVPTPGKSKLSNIRPSILYNTGRVISYTIIGGIVGALGSVISFSGWAKGIVAIAAGLFMVVMGLNMLNIFPWLRRFNPRMPRIFARKVNAEKASGSRGPLYIGLLNGLMPCGPLQAMQLFALSTGSPVKGALSMLFFSLGTVPLMFGLGALSSLLSKKFTTKMMQVSAVLVIILGMVMFQNGMGLSGISVPTSLSGFMGSTNSVNAAAAKVDNGVQLITTELSGGRYEPITVQAGIPVKWTIHAAEGTVNGCNSKLLIPEYNVEKTLAAGDNVIEFTPGKSGTVPYSCWMGMIRSQINVVDDAAAKTGTSGISGAAAGSTITGSTITGNTTAGSAAANGAGGCCAVGAAGPATTTQEQIKAAQIVNGKQQAVITVDGYGYSPRILVIQRGLTTDLTFDIKQTTACSGKINIPELNLQLDLAKDGSIPAFTAQNDFTISCWMNMLSMRVIVVDDLRKADLAAILSDSSNTPQAAGGSCCG